MNNHINAVINEATKPTETDVLRCRRMILERLSSEDLLSTEELATAVARAEGRRPPERRRGAQLPTQSPSVEDVADLPAVLWSRWLLAGLEALGQLQARGTIMGCETPQSASVPSLAAR